MLERNGNTIAKKEWITISLKKRLTFDELVQENRKQILKDRSQIDAIEELFERKHQLPDKKSAT